MEQATIGVTRNGTTVTFSPVLRGAMAPPRPEPPADAEVSDERLRRGSIDGPSSENVDIDVNMSDYCCADVHSSDQGHGRGVTVESSLGGAEVGGDSRWRNQRPCPWATQFMSYRLRLVAPFSQ